MNFPQSMENNIKYDPLNKKIAIPYINRKSKLISEYIEKIKYKFNN